MLLKTMNYKTNANYATQAIAVGYLANTVFLEPVKLFVVQACTRLQAFPNKLFGTILLEKQLI